MFCQTTRSSPTTEMISIHSLKSLEHNVTSPEKLHNVEGSDSIVSRQQAIY